MTQSARTGKNKEIVTKRKESGFMTRHKLAPIADATDGPSSSDSKKSAQQIVVNQSVHGESNPDVVRLHGSRSASVVSQYRRSQMSMQSAGRALLTDRRQENKHVLMTTIQFSMEDLDKGIVDRWVNTNPVVLFLETLEWVSSRLRTSRKHNELLNQLERIQFCRVCEACNIGYADLIGPQGTGENRSGDTNSPGLQKLIFHVRCIAAQANRPVLRVRRIFPAANQLRRQTAHGPGSQQVTRSVIFPNESHQFMLLSAWTVAEALKRITTRLMGIPRTVVNLNQTPTEISLGELVRLLRRTRPEKSNGIIVYKSSAPTCNWLACSSDGTLTIRYPTGDVAIVWTPATSYYRPPEPAETRQPIEKQMTRPRSKTSLSTVSRPMKISPEPNTDGTRSGRPVWNHRIRSSEKTARGFWLFVFDLPQSNRGPHTSQRSAGSTVTPTRGGEPIRDDHEPGQSNCVEMDDRVQEYNQPTTESSSSPSSEYETDHVGQLRALFTPSGEGAIYEAAMNIGNQIFGNSLRAVFTDGSCCLIDTNKSTSQTMPWRTLHKDGNLSRCGSPKTTRRLPVSIDTALNPFVRIHCASPEDLRVSYCWENQVQLTVFCGTQIPRESKQKEAVISTPRKSIFREGSPGGHVMEQFVTKMPFLTSLVESQYERFSAPWRKRREDAFKRIFKDFPSIDGDLERLRKELFVIDDEIR
ncbi:unnamed protein product [Echinostoma caproni]|uniref:Reverse transcriptase domain-containing protein n=1 Tax=Echinostoma caproni TaxID=27848 RepID=A0A183ASX5_9TREM|nr:unnamed protein product [Echinostoma caproni]